MVVFGTRPEAIKMCPLIQELSRYSELDTVVCVSGQHRELLDQILDFFQVVPNYDLEIMKDRQSLNDITSAILLKIKPILEQEKPDIVLVHGDTPTAFAGALAAFYARIPVGHVEAGLRTYDMDSPFPEEFNRTAVGLLASYHFAPTEWARDNLLREGKPKDSVWVTGNTVIDAMKTTISPDYTDENLQWAKGSRLVLLTAHRRENLGEKHEEIFRAIRRVVDELPDVKVLFPVHPNPAVRDRLKVLQDSPRIRMIEPLDVRKFHNYLAHAYLVLTDSGGIQEEASGMGKPTLVLRDVTERPEGLWAGTLRLAGTQEDTVHQTFHLLMTNPGEYEKMSLLSKNPYGDGNACQRIAQVLLERL
nr:UDP-N-acetylglucosamine 2-epimerase (non-hydrolyzing) [Clostridium minihomine]